MKYTRRGLFACAGVTISAGSGCLGIFEETGPRVVGLHATNYYADEVTFSVEIQTGNDAVYEATRPVRGVGEDGIPSGTNFTNVPEKKKPYTITATLNNGLQESLETGEIDADAIWVRMVAGRKEFSDGLYFGVTTDIPERVTKNRSTTE